MKDGCKVYTRVVFDMDTGDTVAEDSFQYFGDLDYCAPYGSDGSDDGGGEGDNPLDSDDAEFEGDGDGDFEDDLDGDDDSDEFTPEELKSQLQELQAKLVELESLQASDTSNTPSSDPVFQELSVVSDADGLDDVLSSPESFNSAINNTLKGFGEQVMKAIPGIVQNAVVQQNSMQEMAKQFYTDNADLGRYKKFVSQVSEKLSSDHPEWGMEKLMDETAQEARKRLNLRKKTQKKSNSNNPGLPKRQSSRNRGRRNTPDPKQSQIAEMNKALGGV